MYQAVPWKWYEHDDNTMVPVSVTVWFCSQERKEGNKINNQCEKRQKWECLLKIRKKKKEKAGISYDFLLD